MISPNAAGKSLLNDRIDWNLLRTFLVIAEERSFSRAAARLFITQSAVSQALRRLEEHLERQLIERHGRRFKITMAGEEVRAVAELMYSQLSRLDSPSDEASNARSDVSGIVRLLIASRVRSSTYDAFLCDLHRCYPRIELQIEVMQSIDIVSALMAKTAYLGVGLYPPGIKKLQHKLFQRQRYAMFCAPGHRLFGRTDIVLDDLADENLVSFPSDTLGAGLSPLSIFRDRNGLRGRVVASSSNHDEIRRLIIAGYGVGFLPEHSVVEDVATRQLWQLPPKEGVADIDLYILWNSEKRPTPAEAAVLEHFVRFVDRVPLADRLSVK